MNYTLRETPKGYIITVKEKRRKHKYFLWDIEHVKEKYIHYILTYGEYELGEPFGDNIHPIYLKQNAIKKVDNAYENTLSDSIKKSRIWNYYRSFITDDSPKKVIKQYADELTSNLQLMGLDGLYQFIQAQA